MNFLSILHEGMERSSAGSRQTSQQVISMCGGCGSALYIGDEAVTPVLLKDAGYDVSAMISDGRRAADAEQAGVKLVAINYAELTKDIGEYGLLWYNGVVDPMGTAERLSQLKEACVRNTVVVFRTLCWLIDPSPDTRRFCENRFGRLPQMDRVLLMAREAGFKVQDFYIAPRTDWTANYYEPLMKAAQEYSSVHGEDAAFGSGFGELKRETDMFELHCEEYSYVYYILKG